MQPTTLRQALTIAAEFFGKSVETNRPELLRKVNEVRSALWKNESNRKTLFRTTGCACVTRFTDDCTNERCRTYFGITLPVNVTGVEYLRARGRRITITAERLENEPVCDGCMEAEQLVRKFPLERDIPASYKNKLRFKAKDAQDRGKLVGVHYISTDGAVIREDLKLTTSGVVTSRNVVELMMLTLPERCGYVEACLIDGSPLDSYHPSILAPAHPRYRIHGVRCATVVNWEAFAEPLDVKFDTDLVEFKSTLDWQNTLMLLDLHFKTGKSSAETFAYKSAAAMSQSSGDAELKATMPVPVVNLRPKSVSRWRRAARWMNRV